MAPSPDLNNTISFLISPISLTGIALVIDVTLTALNFLLDIRRYLSILPLRFYDYFMVKGFFVLYGKRVLIENKISNFQKSPGTYHLVSHGIRSHGSIKLLTCYETEAGGQLGWYLGDEVTSQAASLQAGVLHQEEDGVWDLRELTFTQVCNGTA